MKKEIVNKFKFLVADFQDLSLRMSPLSDQDHLQAAAHPGSGVRSILRIPGPPKHSSYKLP